MQRVVRASGQRRDDLLPTAADLARVRDLVAEFPEAGLSPVTLARVPRLDQDGLRVHLALESLQITGSFKVRGALAALATRKARGERRVVAASAGNHGAGVAWIAKVLGLEARIVVPRTAPRKKVDAISSAGATVIEHDGGYDAAEAAAMRLAEERGEPFVSPYDDLDVVAGNGASLGFEIARALGKAPDVVVAPFGGGGLASGLACVLPTRRVWGVQSEASPAFALSLERGTAVVTLPAAETLAEGLEGGISERAFARASGVVAGVAVVDEAAIARAMTYAERDLGLVVEGSAAAALVPAVEGTLAAVAGHVAADVVVVVTGRNVDRV